MKLLNFLFPAHCIHCEDRLENPRQLLCQTCTEALPWLDRTDRCKRCFTERCSCKMLGALDERVAVFEHVGPASSLLKQFKFGGKEELAEVLASFIIVQLERLNIEWPDLILPIPHAPWHALLRGYQPTLLLAKALSRMMQVKVVRAFKRSFVSIPQRNKSREERLNLTPKSFVLRGNEHFVDKKILLIDDVSTTGSTLGQCASLLRSSYPACITACTFTLAE